MNYKQLIDSTIFLQVTIIRLFRERHGMSHKNFLELNKQKDIIGFLRDGYEPFHLTGDEGVLEELDSFVFGTQTHSYDNPDIGGALL